MNHPTTPPTNRRQWLQASALGLLASTPYAQGFTMGFNSNSKETDIFKWQITTCGYGIDIDPRANATKSSLMYDNAVFDASGRQIAPFYSPMGAAWGRGSDLMGGPPKEGAPLPKRLLFTYYDYTYQKFYQLDAELPLDKLHALFSQKTVNREDYYGKVRPRFDDLRIGAGPDGHIMLWAAGVEDSQVELGMYRAKELPGLTVEAYNQKIKGGFELDPQWWRRLSRAKPETIERIKAGWRPDPLHYMRDIRAKYPWRYKLTGAAARMVELNDYRGDQQSQGVGAWEMGEYLSGREIRGVPEAAKFWFLDHAGKRHHLWISFYTRERALSEDDTAPVRAIFAEMFGQYKPEDDFKVLNPEDWGTVEVHVGEDLKTFTASLVRGDKRMPLPVGRTQYFALNPDAHWPQQETPKPEVVKLFREGPPK